MKNKLIKWCFLTLVSIIIMTLAFVAIGISGDDFRAKRPNKYSTAEDWRQWEKSRLRLAKSFGIQGAEDEKEGIHDGNLIRTLFYNYGSIGYPHREPSVEWPQGSAHGYAYEFGPLVAVEIIDIDGMVKHVVTEGLNDGGDTAPEGYRWGWEPLPGYANPDQPSVALSDKPETHPMVWPDGDPRWPGEFGRGVVVADQESYYKMDDYYNKEFKFYPDPTDSSRGGLGLEVEARGYQWAHILAEDCIFFTYEIKNISAYNYEKVYFGMFGDPHPGGENDYNDDNGYFDTKIDMVFAWDDDNQGDWGPGVGYFGYKFLESPGNAWDGIDNDGDGLIDERMDDGIDNDGDWNEETDDVGADGIGPNDPGYIGPDEGEGDGLPTEGEPNFDGTDLDEADQIGLTGFHVAGYGSISPSDDEIMWQMMKPGIDTSQFAQRADNIFIYSSGPFALPKGTIQRFSIALLCGENHGDLFRNARIVQTIYNAHYHFVKPPDKPKLTAVPSDGRVTLYWDNTAELSRDPIQGYDFEGYAIYRATDFRFNEVRNITDSEGNLIAYEPIAKFDLVNKWEGPHPVGINGFHYHMGYNTGLVHSFVDTTVLNGVTYFYAVAAYDSGAMAHGATPGVPPGECTKRITEDPLRPGQYEFDINTAIVTPRAKAADYKAPEVIGGGPTHVSGPGTGFIEINVLDPLKVRDGHEYEITFKDTTIENAEVAYCVQALTPITEKFIGSKFWFYLNNKHIILDSVIVRDPFDGTIFTLNEDFEISPSVGSIRIINFETMTESKEYELTYNYYPIYYSPFVHGEDRNAYFDGIQVLVHQEDLGLDVLKSQWIEGNCNYKRKVSVYTAKKGVDYPADFEFRFQGTIGDSVRKDDRKSSKLHAPFVLYNVTDDEEARFVIVDNDRNGYWSSGDAVIIYIGETNKVCYEVILTAPAEGDIIHPQAGDIFLVHTQKPYDSRDKFRFSMKAVEGDKEKAKTRLSRVAVVPNPYVATNIAEPKTNFISGRGERRIFFIHLPSECTIRVYSTAGELVTTLHHSSALDDGQLSWDLLNMDGMELSYGVYIFHVQAPEIGEHIGKFAVIK